MSNLILTAEEISNLSKNESVTYFSEICKTSYGTNHYNEKYRNNRVLHPTEIAILENLITPEMKVLDVGCGIGYPYGDWIMKRGCDYTGIDICPEQIEMARNSYPAGNFILDNFLTCPIDELGELYDIVLALYSFFHFPANSQEDALQRMHALCKDKGYLLLLVRAETSNYQITEDWCGSPMVWSHTGDSFVIELAHKLGMGVTRIPATHNIDYIWLVLHKGVKTNNQKGMVNIFVV